MRLITTIKETTMSIFSKIKERKKIQMGEYVKEVSFKELQTPMPEIRWDIQKDLTYKPIGKNQSSNALNDFVELVNNNPPHKPCNVSSTEDIAAFISSTDESLNSNEALKAAEAIKKLYHSEKVHIPEKLNRPKNSMKM